MPTPHGSIGAIGGSRVVQSTSHRCGAAGRLATGERGCADVGPLRALQLLTHGEAVKDAVMGWEAFPECANLGAALLLPRSATALNGFACLHTQQPCLFQLLSSHWERRERIAERLAHFIPPIFFCMEIACKRPRRLHILFLSLHALKVVACSTTGNCDAGSGRR